MPTFASSLTNDTNTWKWSCNLPCIFMGYWRLLALGSMISMAFPNLQNTFEPLLIGLMCWSCRSMLILCTAFQLLRYQGVSACPWDLCKFGLEPLHLDCNAPNWSLSTRCISNAVAQAIVSRCFKYIPAERLVLPWLLQVAVGDLKPRCSCFRRLEHVFDACSNICAALFWTPILHDSSTCSLRRGNPDEPSWQLLIT